MRRLFSLILVVASVAGTASGQEPDASIVFDGSLSEDSYSGPAPSEIDVDGVRVYTIAEDKGTYSGANLFHSFDQFSILSGEEAQFTADLDLGVPERVIARVTGASKSEIYGSLTSTVMYERDGAQHAADLYLVNPYGIRIGGDAVVNVPGSLYLSTAHAIRFEEGPDFHTYGTDVGGPAMGMLLSSEPPAAFGFSDPNPFGLSNEQAEDFGRIHVERETFGTGYPKFYVAPGKTLALIGSDTPSDNPNPGVDLDSSSSGSRQFEIDASRGPEGSEGNVQIASAAGVVDIPIDIRNLDPALPDSQPLGHVRINNFFAIDAGDPKGSSTTGEIVIRGSRFTLAESSVLTAASSIDVGVSDDIQIASKARVSARDITMTGSSITVTDLNNDLVPKPGTLIEGGSVELRADEIEISGDSTVGVTTRYGADNLLAIDANVLRIERGGKLESLASNFGTGSDINITADERVVVSGSSCPSSSTCDRSMIRTKSEGGLPGDAGEVWIEAPIVEIVDGGVIDVSDRAGDGEVDGITILASDRVTIARGSEIEGASVVRSQSIDEGNAGGLRIAPLDGSDVLRVELHDGGQASATTSGTAAAGSVDITADVVEVTGFFVTPSTGGVVESGIFSQSTLVHTPGGPVGGPAGSVAIAAKRLVVGDHGRIGVGTSGDGDAGIIRLEIGEALEVFGPVHTGALGNIEASNRVEHAEGRPGDIEILVGDPNGRVVLRDGAVITAQSLKSEQPAGSVTIVAGGRFEATGFSVTEDADGKMTRTRSGVTTASENTSGGNITIAASNLVYLLDGEIRTSVSEEDGDGGNVAIGDPTLGIPEFVVLNEGRVIASAAEGRGGTIDIETGTFFASAPFEINPEIPPDRGSFLDATSTISGLTGTINVEPPETELVTELASLSAAFLDVTELLGSACEARTSRAGSFQVVKRHAADLAPPDAALAPVGLQHAAPGIRVLPVGTDLCASPEETL